MLRVQPNQHKYERPTNWGRNVNTPLRKAAPKTDDYPEPISGEPGAHAMGTGKGAAAGGVAAGALVGAVAGPFGAIVGAAIGAAAGGLVGKSISAALEASAEQTRGHRNSSRRTDAKRDWNFEDYGRAYRFGAEAYEHSKGGSFDDAEPELKLNWERARGNSMLPWKHAKYTSREAWQRASERLDRAPLGDSERDGK